MSFLDHLGELRYRLLVCICAIMATTLLIGFPFAKPFIRLLILPLRKAELREKDKPLTIVVAPDGAMKIKNPSEAMDQIAQDRASTFRLDFVFEEGADPTASPSATAESPSATAESPSGTAESPSGTTFRFGPQLKQDLYYFSPFDPFFLIMKAALLLGVALAVPIWLYQLWAFIKPAFKPDEIKTARPILASSVLLFPLGAGFAYFGVRFVLQTLFNSFFIEGLEPRLAVQRYASLVLMLMLVFGCVFETPVVIVLLTRAGLVRVKTLRATRRYAVLVIAVLSATFTPADPFSMALMAAPMYVLYELSIWISVALDRRERNQPPEAEAQEETA